MRSFLIIVGAVSMAMASPFPAAQLYDTGYDVVVPTAQESTGDDNLLEISYEDNQTPGEKPLGPEDRIAYAGSGGGVTVDGSINGYENYPETDQQYELAKESMTPSERKFNNFKCGKELSVCCIDQPVHPFVQDLTCNIST